MQNRKFEPVSIDTFKVALDVSSTFQGITEDQMARIIEEAIRVASRGINAVSDGGLIPSFETMTVQKMDVEL